LTGKKWKFISTFLERIKKIILKNSINLIRYYIFYDLAYFLLNNIIVMLTRREVLMELRRLGMGTPSSLKISLREFERYMGTQHGLEIVKTKKEASLPLQTYQGDKNTITIFLNEIRNEHISVNPEL
jgi:hypothetical protein